MISHFCAMCTNVNLALSLLLVSDCSDGDVRVVGGAREMEGRVEVCLNHSYLSVCDDFWDQLEASVVCRQLGYLGDSE